MLKRIIYTYKYHSIIAFSINFSQKALQKSANRIVFTYKSNRPFFRVLPCMLQFSNRWSLLSSFNLIYSSSTWYLVVSYHDGLWIYAGQGLPDQLALHCMDKPLAFVCLVLAPAIWRPLILALEGTVNNSYPSVTILQIFNISSPITSSSTWKSRSLLSCYLRSSSSVCMTILIALFWIFSWFCSSPFKTERKLH